MFVDFHTHLHSYPDDSFLSEIESLEILSIACSMDLPSYRRSLALAERTPLIIPTFGIHPLNAARPFDEAEALAAMEDSALIGEIGLDRVWARDVGRRAQERVFSLFLDHCDKKRKYAVIHTKGAEGRVLQILSGFPRAKPIIHWYHGPEKLFDEILGRGYPCTFGCELLHSANLRRLFGRAPLELVLAETDNPDSEIWLGGSKSSPSLIVDVVRAMAEIRGLSPRAMNEAILLNSRRILGEAGIAPGRLPRRPKERLAPAHVLKKGKTSRPPRFLLK